RRRVARVRARASRNGTPLARGVLASAAMAASLLAGAAPSQRASGGEAHCTFAAALPFCFEENLGQTDPEVRFLARTAGGAAFVTPSGMTLRARGAPRSVVRMRLPG